MDYWAQEGKQTSHEVVRGDDCLDVGSNSRNGEKLMALRCFRDRACIALQCGKGSLDIYVEQLNSCEFEKVKIAGGVG